MSPVFAHFSKFSMYAWGKKRKLLVFTAVYVCVKAKLTFVSFFSIFFLHLSLTIEWFKTPKPISGIGIGMDGWDWMDLRVDGGIEHLTVLITRVKK